MKQNEQKSSHFSYYSYYNLSNESIVAPKFILQPGFDVRAAPKKAWPLIHEVHSRICSH